MRFAYIAADLSIESLASLVQTAVPGAFDMQERDGLNIGGGQYFLFTDKERQLVLCWSEAYADPPEPRFRYCVYVLKGPDNLLEQAVKGLSNQQTEVVVS